MISKISLKNYRNLNLEADLSGGGNLIAAPNGSGKSNFLESIYILYSGRSFRPLANFGQLVGPNADFARNEVRINGNSLACHVTTEGEKAKKQYLFNGKRTTLSKLSGKIPVILFAPHSVDLVAGDPSLRRKDLDDFLSGIYSDYNKTLKKYVKLLKNRNALLRHIREYPSDTESASTLNYWTTELVNSAIEIMHTRLSFLKDIEEYIVLASSEVYHYSKNNLSVKYLSKHPSTDAEAYGAHLTEKFNQRYDLEIATGQTMYGPHKDDYSLVFNDEDLRYLGSRGQQRLAVFTWKYAQHKFTTSELEQTPVLLVDDLMSELDIEHQEQMGDFLMNKLGGQFVITSASIRDIPDKLVAFCNSISLLN